MSAHVITGNIYTEYHHQLNLTENSQKKGIDGERILDHVMLYTCDLIRRKMFKTKQQAPDDVIKTQLSLQLRQLAFHLT